jgi:hypothetical protein
VGKAVIWGLPPNYAGASKKIIIEIYGGVFGVILVIRPQPCLLLWKKCTSRFLRSAILLMCFMRTVAMPTDFARLVLAMIDCPAITPL